jgi:tRNA threonylcarbamoyladenosine biosynthesis protein TsaE
MIISGTEQDLPKLAESLLNEINDKYIILTGELGAGKTTLVRHMVSLLGGGNVAVSPTFSVHNSYNTPTGFVLHSDLYRLESLPELENTGFWELAEDAERVFIEWGEKFGLGKVLGQHTEIQISQNQSGRSYVIKRIPLRK